MRRLVVAVSREFGSGGRLLGERIAQELDLRFYDRALIALAARESGFAPEAFEDAETEAANKFLFSLSMGGGAVRDGLFWVEPPVGDQLFIAQSKVIERLAEEGIPISLSISLHAPTEELRSQIMPVNRKYPLADVLRAARMYAERTKRRITYEYILIRDLNDGVREAEQLAKLLRGQLASVNLIPINPVAERNLYRPDKAAIRRFQKILEERHITATLRREMGTDIQAACGQLRNRLMEAGL